MQKDPLRHPADYEDMKELKLLVRPNIQALIENGERKFPLPDYHSELRLHANESPYNAPYNRYSNTELRLFCEEMGRLRGLREDCIFPAGDCEELVDLLLRLFCVPQKDNVVSIKPTSPMYAHRAALNDVECRCVSLSSNFELSAEKLLAAADENTKLMLLCNPNDITGTLFPWSEVKALLKGFEGIVVIDESYIDFARCESVRKELVRHPNLVVLDTFSVAWGAAALRLGVAYAVPAIVAYLKDVAYSRPLSIPVLEKGREFIKHRFDVDQWVKRLLEERDRMAEALKLLPFCEKIFPSAANFLLVRFKNADLVYAYLSQQGISVLPAGCFNLCENCLRISVGLPHQNSQLLGALRKFPYA